MLKRRPAGQRAGGSSSLFSFWCGGGEEKRQSERGKEETERDAAG